MKYAVILMDGAADRPLQALGGKTPLQAAQKPTLDYLSKRGRLGMVNTVPPGMDPGSDTANLSILGYDPQVDHTGRSSLEAASMGVELGDEDISFRCNVVTLSDESEYHKKKMLDHSAGDIPTGQARELMKSVNQELGGGDIRFYPGFGYRHLMVWSGGPQDMILTPPHDILGKEISRHLPRGDGAGQILGMMERSSVILEKHPVNASRTGCGMRPANSIWIWGSGKKPKLTPFYEKFGIRGAVISAVDLIKGIGISAGLKKVDVEGATGNLNTNFLGKSEAAIKELRDNDFVFIHLEAPDECGHQGDVQGKIEAIEQIDCKVIKPVWEFLNRSGFEYRMMVLADHPTPISIRTHTSDPVPFLIYGCTDQTNNSAALFDEFWPQENGLKVSLGHELLNIFFRK